MTNQVNQQNGARPHQDDRRFNWTPEQLSVIRTLDPKLQAECPPEVILRWLAMCDQNEVSPFSGMLHIVGRRQKVKWYDEVSRKQLEDWQEVYTIQPSVDLYRCKVQKSGTFDGMEDFEYERDDKGFLLACRVRGYRKGVNRPISARRTFAAVAQGRNDGNGWWRPNSFWEKDPEGMLEKATEMQLYRRGWADALFGLPDDEGPSEESLAERISQRIAHQMVAAAMLPQPPAPLGVMSYAPQLRLVHQAPEAAPIQAVTPVALHAPASSPPASADLWQQMQTIWEERVSGAPAQAFLTQLEQTLLEVGLRPPREGHAGFVRGMNHTAQGPALLLAWQRRCAAPPAPASEAAPKPGRVRSQKPKAESVPEEEEPVPTPAPAAQAAPERTPAPEATRGQSSAKPMPADEYIRAMWEKLSDAERKLGGSLGNFAWQIGIRTSVPGLNEDSTEEQTMQALAAMPGELRQALRVEAQAALAHIKNGNELI